MHKSTLLLISCLLLFSCEKIKVEPKNIDYKGNLLEKVVIRDNYVPTVTIDFDYYEDGRVKSARKIFILGYTDSTIDYSMEYPNDNEYILKVQSHNYSKTEHFYYSNNRVAAYSVEETSNGSTDTKSYTLSYGTALNTPDYIISQTGDSIHVNNSSPGNYELEYVIPKPAESLAVAQKAFTYRNSEHSVTEQITGTYSDLHNPFQKEVWDVFGIKLGSRLLTLASNNLANESLIFSLKNENIPDGGTFTYEYLYDEDNRLTNINEFVSGGYPGYPGNNGNMPVLSSAYVLSY